MSAADRQLGAPPPPPAPSAITRGLLGLLLAGTALSPLNTKLAGAAWLLLLLLALWLGAGPSRPRPAGAQAAATAWLLSCLAAMALWTGLSWVWDEPCCKLTADLGSGLRLLLAATATWVVARHRAAFAGRWLPGAAAAACVFALVLALSLDRDRLPSHPIPWAVAVSFLVCLLWPHALDGRASPRGRAVWAFSAGCGIAAVLASQSRGAYAVLPWVLLLAALALRRRHRLLRPRSMGIAAVLLASALAAAISLPGDPLRVRRAWQEVDLAVSSSDYNSSLGARVFLFQMAWNGIHESPWIGLGATERLQRIRHAGEQLPPEQRERLTHVRQLGHAHNQYLHNALDGGLLGLAGLLALLAGMAVAARRLWRLSPVAGQQMAGLLLMHAVAGLSNVNFAHNYYAVMLSLCIALVFLDAESAPPAHARPDHSQG